MIATTTDNQKLQLTWPPKPEIHISLELCLIASKFQRQFWGFRPCRVQIKYFPLKRPYCYFRLSVAYAIIWGHFLWTSHGRKPQNGRWNFDAIYHSSRDISTSGLGCHIAISGCRSLSQSLSLNSPWSKTPGSPLKRNTFVVLLYLNSWGLFFYPQAASATRGLNY